MDKLQQGYINLKRAKDELKKYRKIILDTCLQDREYQTKYLEMGEMRKVLRKRRDELVDVAMLEKLERLSEQVRLEKQSLSDWVAEYYSETKMTSVSIQDSLFDIVPSYQLKPKNG